MFIRYRGHFNNSPVKSTRLCLGNWQLIITHNSCQRFESLQKKIDETQSKLGTVIHSKV